LGESLFEIGKNLQVVRVWRTKEQKYNLDCLELTFKSGRTSTMVWGAFFGTTKAPLVLIPPKSRKAADFIEEVYKPSLVPFLQEHDPNHSRRLVLMEDGAPVHKAKLLAAFLAESKIDKIPNWPPQSPDLNPTENVWKVLKTNIQEHYRPKSVNEMHKALKQAWSNFPQQTLVNILASMPEQMKAVIKACGGPTQW
jgi:transposase